MGRPGRRPLARRAAGDRGRPGGRAAPGGDRTRRIVESTPPDTPAALGGRFTDPARRPTLVAILLHVLQEYARHAGHLDVVRELTDGRTGE
nr:DUF664 domain-containing protein [Micromonospora auratinigra]